MARTDLAKAGLASSQLRNDLETPDILNAESSVERAMRTRTSTSSGDLMKSGLAGAGAGFVFGPVAGLLTFGVSKFLHDRNRQGLEAYTAQSAERADAILESSQAVISELKQNATTDQERAEVAVLEKQYENLRQGVYHPNSDVAAGSLLAIQELTGTLYTNLDDWQAERAEATERARAENKRQFDIADNIRADTQREATRYIQSLEAFDKLEGLKAQGNTASDTALVKSLANLVEPGAIITDSDFAVLQQNPAIDQEAARLYMSVIKGEGTLTPQQRSEIFNTGRVIMQQQVGYQAERNDLAIDRARLANLSPDYQQTVIVPIPDTIRDRTRDPDPVPPRKPADTFKPVTSASVVDIAGGVVDGAMAFITDVGRQLRGEQVMIDGEGRMIVRDAEGNQIEDLGYADQWRNADGDVIRRINGPNGPTFENVTEKEKMRREGPSKRAGREAYERASERGGTLRAINE